MVLKEYSIQNFKFAHILLTFMPLQIYFIPLWNTKMVKGIFLFIENILI